MYIYVSPWCVGPGLYHISQTPLVSLGNIVSDNQNYQVYPMITWVLTLWPPGLVEKARFSRCFTFNLSPPHVDCGRCERSWHTAMLIEVSAHCLLGHGGQSRSYGGPPAAEELLRRPHLAPRRPLPRPATEDLYMAMALSDDPSSFRRLLGASEGGLWMVSLGPERPSYVGTCIWMSCGTFLHACRA